MSRKDDSVCDRPMVQVFRLKGRDSVLHLIDKSLITLPDESEDGKSPSFQVHNLTGRDAILAVLDAKLAFALKRLIFNRETQNSALIAFAHQLENAYEEEAA